MSTTGALIDSYGRVLRDLRVSVTDRCNFRCMYCLPETEAAQNFYRGRWATLPQPAPLTHQWQPRSKILTFEEIERIVRIALNLGVQKIRLTGGEPLLRQELELLVARLGRIDAIHDLAITTNGFLFPKKGKALRDAGLRRVSFSLDSLDADNFKRITGRDGLSEVLASIELAQELGLSPVKVNSVVILGINDHESEALAEFGRSRGLTMRFIEFMPLDSGRVWLKELVVPGKEILARIQARFSLFPIKSENKSETAKRWGFADSEAEIGIIAPVSEPFCGHCNRLRLTVDGKIRTCLFSTVEHDLRTRLRSGADDQNLSEYLAEIVLQKEDRHHIGEENFVQPDRPMSCIGG